MYWDIDKTLSHNCLFNLVFGNRGAGKTYGAIKRAIMNHKKDGKAEFIYLRRYKSEFEDVKSFFSAIIKNNEFPDDKLEVQGMKFYINDKLFGYAVALSTATKKKSVSFPNVTFIIMDEFIIEKSVLHYLRNEVKIFLDFYVTVSRYERDVRVVFLANAITMQNPYCLHFNLYLPHGKNITKRNDVLLELVENPEFTRHVKQTRVGKLLLDNDPEYSNFAIENKFMIDNRIFIEKKPAHARHNFNIVFHGNTLGVWADWVNGILYVSKDTDPSNGLTFAITTDDHTPNTLLIKYLSGTQTFKTFIDAYKMGCVRFESQRIKAISNDMLRLVIR